MNTTTALERYLDSVRWQTQRGRTPRAAEGVGPRTAERLGVHRPMIAMSRQAGSGAHVVANELVARLGAASAPNEPPWTIFDRNLVNAVLERHDLPERLADFMPEDRVSEIADAIDSFFGLHPSASTLVRKTADTILRLAEIGNVVVIGRGAVVVTAELDYAFRVRLVGSLERRIRYAREHLGLDERSAEEFVNKEDMGRRRYVKKYYGKDVDDPLLYHLVVNTDEVPYDEAARIIADAVEERIRQRERAAEAPDARDRAIAGR
jgi:cytidylate kinase